MSKVSISFNLKQPNATKETLIVSTIRWNGQRIKTSLKESVNPVYWNFKKKRVKDVIAVKDRDDINDSLDNFQSGVRYAFRELEKKNGDVWKGDLKHEIDVLLGRANKLEAPTDFIKYIEYLVKLRTGQINPNTKRVYSERTFSKYKYVGKLCLQLDPNISFNSFDKKFYAERFEKFLISKGFALNTIGKYTQTLKAILRNAKEDGIISKEDFKAYIVHKVESHNIYLTETEITKIFSLDLSATPYLDRVRDIFVLGTQTGLRFSDIYRIKPHHVDGDVITIKTFKSPTEVEIPIFPKTRDILEKYPNGLPHAISNQNFNEYVKEVGKRAGLTDYVIKKMTHADGEHTFSHQKWELISSHTMRRSFCTNLYLAEYPILGICAISGHKTESEFIKYVKVSKKENAKRLLDFYKKKQQTKEMYGS